MNIFNNARIKLTLYYLAVIMIISLFFSAIIYRGTIFELNRIESMQRLKRGNPQFVIDPEIIRETKSRILFSLLTLNLIILGFSGVSGYFLASKTLDPIKEMMDEQKEFVSNASHELRTPLSSLKSQIEVGLRDKKMTLSEARDLLSSNLEDVNSMTNLSNYLLKLNKFQSGNFKKEFSKIDLSEVVKKAVGKQKVKYNFEKTFIIANEESVIEMTTILVDNAIKYGLGKTVEVTVKKPGTVIVRDYGIGISEIDLPHIFDRFFRADKVRNKDGFGLGLSIAKQIADLHGARIKVTSKAGIGTVFKVVFS